MRRSPLAGLLAVAVAALALAPVPAYASGSSSADQQWSDFLAAHDLQAGDGWTVTDHPAGPLGTPGDIDMVNRNTGQGIQISSDGRSFVVRPPSTTQPRIGAPSSVLSTSVGDSANAAQAASAGLADSNTLATTGRLSIVGSKLAGGAAAGITAYSGLQIGLQAGFGLDKIECHFGVSGLCMPKSAGYVPNSDVVVNNDPGWKHGNSWLMYHNGGAPVQINVAAVAPLRNVGDDLGAAGGVQFQADTTLSGSTAYADCNDPAATDYTSCAGATNGTVFVQASAGGAFTVKGTALNGVANAVPCKVFFYSTTPDGTAFTGPAWSPDNAADPPAAEYDFPGCSARGQDVAPDPTRTWRTTVTCSGGSIVSASSAAFHETDATIPEYPDAPSCPVGERLVKIKVEELGGPTPRTIVPEYTVPQQVQDWQSSDCGNGKARCQLDLLKVDPGTGVKTSCYSLGSACAQWFTDPNKTSDYQCTYGPASTERDVDLSECNILAPTFDPSKQAQGVTTGDPRTGQIPDSPAEPAPAPAPVSTGGMDCWTDSWGGLNVAAGMLDAVKCALVWAFVPSSSALADFTTTIKSAYDATAIGEWLTALGGLSLTPPGGTCRGMQVDLPLMVTTAHVDFFSYCEQPWSGLALTVKSVLTVIIAWFSLTGVFRMVASSFGLELNWGRRDGS